MGPLLFAISSLFGSVLAWRALRESSFLLILALGPLLGSSAVVALSNARLAPSITLLVLLVASVVLAMLPGREKPVWEPLTRWQGGALGVLALVVLVYTHYHGVHVLDADRWLHDSQINAFRRGIYPPVNPLFPELAMNGHFGRDLYMATLSSQGTDPAITTRWVQPLIQLATFLMLFASTRSITGSVSRGLLVSSMIFFGLDCGFRVGLIDTFDGSNGLAYPHFVLLFHLMFRILQGAKWPVWLVAGVALGTYQLVYMTSFALLLLAGFVLFLLKARTRQAWIGLLITGFLSVGLAVTEGGAFTDMAHRGLRPELNKAVQNQGLRVTVQFPKENLFCVLTSTAGYYRTSVAYQTSLFRGFYVPAKGEGNVSIWSFDFMRAHWLPLYLAPLTLWALRRSTLGIAFWVLGAISYLLPGLFYFGPIFEYEFYRFEFSAAFGFAGALGLALGEWMEDCPLKLAREPVPSLSFGKGSARYLAALVVLVASLAAGEKAINDAFIASQKRGFKWFPNSREWRLSEPTFGMTVDSLAACDWLNARTKPGQQVMTNLLSDRPMGIWPDMVAATLSGVFPAGHAYPSETEGGPHGNPAFHRNSVYRAFWATGDLTLLEGSKVAWLLADTKTLDAKVKAKLEALPHQSFGDFFAAEMPTAKALPAAGSWTIPSAVRAPADEKLRLGARYPLSVTFDNDGEESRAVLTLDKGLVEPLRFAVPKGGGPQELSLVTPLDEGVYTATISDLSGQARSSFTFTVDFLERLNGLTPVLSFPQMKAHSFSTLQGHWESSKPIHSEAELDLAYRFKRPDGDYAWEVDSIPQSLNLALPESPEFKLQIFSPTLPGQYELELWFFDRGSGRQVKLAKSFAVVVE